MEEALTRLTDAGTCAAEERDRGMGLAEPAEFPLAFIQVHRGVWEKPKLVLAYEENSLLSQASVRVLVIGMFCLERNNLRILKMQYMLPSVFLLSTGGGSCIAYASSVFQRYCNGGVLFQKQATPCPGL